MDINIETPETFDPIINNIPPAVQNKETQDMEKISASVTDLCEKFEYEVMRCINCPIILECRYPTKKIEPLKAEATKISEEIYEEELELDNSAENTLRAQSKRDYIYNQYLKDNAFKTLRNDRCMFEKKEILTALQKFVDAGYDILDPRVYMIIKELVSNILNSGRANKAFTNLGLLLKKETPAGPIYYQNPLLKPKIDLSKLIVESTEALDRMLKSDETTRAEKDFTQHLLKELKIREMKKKRLLEAVDAELL